MAYNWEGILVCDRVATHITIDGDRYAYFYTKKLYVHKFVKCGQCCCKHVSSFYMIMYNHIRKVCFVCIQRIWLGNIVTFSILSQYEPSSNLFQNLKEPLRGACFSDLTPLNNDVS